ncbi:O-antigen ligase family protein [Tamlana fucoidanivorans]|uniref:O-antigen ligase family protein n=1 Tax=Allotamlana fucoidanivorans TaxID=2583814 RepID=A0A5C4SRJ2_9FLAO|nr:O-antigen ligase family protein [Tamlana fucoidanivorans]TNJ47046.1 O-antigen ligase family protein [Tamlana fucoidanivorans]
MKITSLLRKKNILNVLLLFLPLSVFIDNLCLILILVIAFIEGIKGRQIKYKPLLYSLPFMLYIMLRSLSEGYFFDDLKFFKLILPLILIPFSFQIFSKTNFINACQFLCLGIVIMQLISTYGIIDYYLLTEGKKVALRNYGKINEILRFERPYLGFFSAVNIILGYYFFKMHKKGYYIISVFLSVCIIFLISARMGLLIVIVSFGVVFYNELKGIKTKMMTLISFLFAISLLFYFSDLPIKHRFQMIKYDPRLIIWSGGLEQLQSTKDYFMGTGSQKLIEVDLLNFYKTEAEFEYLPDKNRFIDKNYNLHNQYLNELVRGGIIGVILFIYPFTLFLLRSIKEKNLLQVLLLVSILLFLLVENLLERQVGVYSIALFLTFAIYRNDEN